MLRLRSALLLYLKTSVALVYDATYYLYFCTQYQAHTLLLYSKTATFAAGKVHERLPSGKYVKDESPIASYPGRETASECLGAHCVDGIDDGRWRQKTCGTGTKVFRISTLTNRKRVKIFEKIISKLRTHMSDNIMIILYQLLI